MLKTTIILLLIGFASCYHAQKIENRILIKENLRTKIANNEPLIAHVLVPLCDNKHQGIVPTAPSIGNGLDIKRNLYWATSKGMKRFFKELPDWKLVYSTLDPDSNILERVVFFKKFTNGAKVYLIADAYRGDRMSACLNDYFNALSSHKNETIIVEKDTLGIYGQADLVAFNGHNGLMDEETTYFKARSNAKVKDAVSISCLSGDYFKQNYEATRSYPLVHTTNLLYPGAFVIEGILNQWAMLKDAASCKVGAGKGYYKHKPKSGPNGSQNLFEYGWMKINH